MKVWTMTIALLVAACGGGGDGASEVRCWDWGGDAVNACGCSAEGVGLGGDEDPSGPERESCSDTSFLPETICCASEGWPGGDSACNCLGLRCGNDQFGGCTCTYNPFAEDVVPSQQTSCSPPLEGGTCCMSDDTGFCRCSTQTTCSSPSYQVASCGPEVIQPCYDNEFQIDTCEVSDDGDDGIRL